MDDWILNFVREDLKVAEHRQPVVRQGLGGLGERGNLLLLFFTTSVTVSLEEIMKN